MLNVVPIPSLNLDHDVVAPISWWSMHWHPDMYAGVLGLTGLYLLFAGPLRGKFVSEPDAGISRLRVLSFLSGSIILLWALAGPLHELADYYLFSAHMAQHILLTLVIPPLFMIGVPGWMILPLLKIRVVRISCRFITSPLIAFVIFNVVFSVWHFPLFYEGALYIHGFHILEHILFLAAAIIGWWPVLSPVSEVPRIPYPTQILYLAALSISQTPLFAVITFSDQVIYDFYSNAPMIWGITPLVDQQMGGIIMKLGWLLVFLPAICIVFLRWYHLEEGQKHV